MQQRCFRHGRRATEVAADVPAWPFTLSQFVTHLARLRIRVTPADAAALLAALVASGSVVKLGPNIEMWVGVEHLDAVIDALDATTA